MPVYELSLVFKVLPRAELASALKRVGCLLMDEGAKLRKLENLGTKDLPYRFNSKDVDYYKGSYFIYSFISSPKIFPKIVDECTRDVDIIRHHLGDEYKDLSDSCTLHEELNPPALRKSVQDLLEKGKRKREMSKKYYRHVKEYTFYDIYE